MLKIHSFILFNLFLISSKNKIISFHKFIEVFILFYNFHK